MSILVFSTLCFLVLISETNGINCVSCIGWANTGCNDPYDETTSGDIPVPGNTYCLKVVYPTYIERMAGGRACTSGSGPGSSTRYCCSDKDYCNGARHSTMSGMKAVAFLMIFFLVKHEFFC